MPLATDIVKLLDVSTVNLVRYPEICVLAEKYLNSMFYAPFICFLSSIAFSITKVQNPQYTVIFYHAKKEKKSQLLLLIHSPFPFHFYPQPLAIV